MIPISDKIFNYCKNQYYGFYIECGCNDGVQQSNTFNLEKRRDWLGLLIDASPISIFQCQQNRSQRNIFINAVLTSSEHEGKMFPGNFNGNLGGRVGNGDYLIKGITLTSILREYSITSVDLFSLDVEGYELGVLKGLDFSYCSPKLILVEIWNSKKEEIFQLLEKNGYTGENFSQFNKEDNPMWNGLHNDYLFKK
jgi:FkbM family methyltransferase